MPRVIISDTSCIILLDKIGYLNILHKLFGKVLITSIVANEFGKQIPEYFEIVNPRIIIISGYLKLY